MDPISAVAAQHADSPAASAAGRQLPTTMSSSEDGSRGDWVALTEKLRRQHVTGIFSKLDLPTSGDDHRRVLAVLRFLDGPG